jgi:two-component system sensor histidine kinase TctE
LSGRSLRARLLLGILVPVLAFVLINAVTLYRHALATANTAYDRTLLASAKSLGELLEVTGEPGRPQLVGSLLYSALEAFEADTRSRMYYRVSGFDGGMVSGFADLPPPRPPSGQRNVYAALVEFYDDTVRGEPVRMAVLLQPVAGPAGQGMATIQVAETLELRHTLARQLLLQALVQQALLLALIAGVVLLVVQRATRPVRALSEHLRNRADADLSPLPASLDVPRELQPVMDATNAMLARTAALLDHQKRFVRDASHQLRTPLAVLKTQLQSARRGDVAPEQALDEIAATVDGATELANQMLALARIEQLRQQPAGAEPPPVHDWATIVRAVALDLGPLIAAAQLDFEIETRPAPIRAHAWVLRELTRNLLHNAVRHGPPGSRLAVRLTVDGRHAALTITDEGPGLSPTQRQRLFQPFASGGSSGGSGLGLVICQGLVQTLEGHIELNNREHGGPVQGLDAVVRLPLAIDAAGAIATGAAHLR